jgi:hypothetical protein
MSAVNVAVPAPVPCAVKVNCFDCPPLIVAFAGVGPESIVGDAAPEGVKLGATVNASASPVLLTVTVMVIV